MMWLNNVPPQTGPKRNTLKLSFPKWGIQSAACFSEGAQQKELGGNGGDVPH